MRIACSSGNGRGAKRQMITVDGSSPNTCRFRWDTRKGQRWVASLGSVYMSAGAIRYATRFLGLTVVVDGDSYQAHGTTWTLAHIVI